MSLHFRQWLGVIAIFSLGVLPASPQTATKEDHIVSGPELHQAVRAAASTRETNLAKIDKLFSTEAAKNAFRTVKFDPAKVSHAIAQLSDEEVAKLAARSEKLQNDLAAGALTNQQITYILIALATAVIILVLVAV